MIEKYKLKLHLPDLFFGLDFFMATVGMSSTDIICLGLHSAAGYSPRYTGGSEPLLHA